MTGDVSIRVKWSEAPKAAYFILQSGRMFVDFFVDLPDAKVLLDELTAAVKNGEPEEVTK